jgi:type II secretory pathway component PulM
MSEFERDPSANTGRFRAFVERADEDLPSPWRMRAPASRALLLAAGVVLVAVVIGVVAMSLAG